MSDLAWQKVLVTYRNARDTARQTEDEFDGWLARILQVDGVETEALPRWHGKLIAWGYLKFQLAGRGDGVRYQITPAGTQALEMSIGDEVDADEGISGNIADDGTTEDYEPATTNVPHVGQEESVENEVPIDSPSDEGEKVVEKSAINALTSPAEVSDNTLAQETDVALVQESAEPTDSRDDTVDEIAATPATLTSNTEEDARKADDETSGSLIDNAPQQVTTVDTADDESVCDSASVADADSTAHHSDDQPANVDHVELAVDADSSEVDGNSQVASDEESAASTRAAA